MENNKREKTKFNLRYRPTAHLCIVASVGPSDIHRIYF